MSTLKSRIQDVSLVLSLMSEVKVLKNLEIYEALKLFKFVDEMDRIVPETNDAKY